MTACLLIIYNNIYNGMYMACTLLKHFSMCLSAIFCATSTPHVTQNTLSSASSSASTFCQHKACIYNISRTHCTFLGHV